MVALVAGGHHTCALRDDGTAWCCGDNLYGQIGVGDGYTRFAPAAVAGADRFVSLAAGDNATCGLRADGPAACWGRLGDATASSQTQWPTNVAGL